jgi:hypothetical protein
VWGLGRTGKYPASEPPHPRSLRSLDLSPLGRGEIEARSRGALCPSLRNQFVNDQKFSLFASFYSLFPIPFSLFVISPSKKKGRRNADRRRSNHRACTRRALSGARTPVGVPPRLSPKGIIPSQRLGFRPGFLGRGLNGRYPSSPVPVQGCTSRPGRNAGRHDAQAARERTANPPAGTAPAPPFGLPPEGVLK